MAHSHSTAVENVGRLQGLLARLGLQEATHKATPPATSMIWLGLLFDCETMTITLPLSNIRKYWICLMFGLLAGLPLVLMDKLLCVAQVYSLDRLFLNRMLETLRACPPSGLTPSCWLSQGSAMVLQVPTQYRRHFHYT